MNAKAHKIISASACAAYALVDEINLSQKEERDVNLLRILSYGVGGWLLGCLPDLLEPATSSNHRKFFHRIVFGLGGISVINKIREETEHPILKEILNVVAIAYGSHLGADFTTPKSLLLVHPKII